MPFLNLIADNNISHLRHISDSILGLSVAVILMILVVEGQRSLRSSILAQRRDDYKNIGDQIIKWLKNSGSEVFEPGLVNSEKNEEQEIYRNFAVSGSALKIADRDKLTNQEKCKIEQYCQKVHFELTTYPNEIIYGIHFEFSDYNINYSLCKRLKRELALDRQSSDIHEDNLIPKKPDWIFLTRTINFDGDINDNFPKVLTHGRHFVEFVCHNFDIVYGKVMVSFFLKQIK